MNTIKVREEGGSVRKPGAPPGLRGSGVGIGIPPIGGAIPGAGPIIPGMLPAGTTASGAPQQYNRYDQERFTKSDAPISGFRIDTTSTYHGLTLKSVTEGSAQPKAPLSGSNSVQNGSSSSSSSVLPQKPQKRVSRTPIIIIPATNTSQITMYNAKAILQDLKYTDLKSCDQKRDNEVLIHRVKADGSTVPYRIIDNPLKLNPEDW